MQMKYIMINGFDPVIFSDRWTHANLAFNLNIDPKDITSAGFIQLTEKGAHCYGSSTSLGKAAAPGDAARINSLAGDNFD